MPIFSMRQSAPRPMVAMVRIVGAGAMLSRPVPMGGGIVHFSSSRFWLMKTVV